MLFNTHCWSLCRLDIYWMVRCCIEMPIDWWLSSLRFKQYYTLRNSACTIWQLQSKKKERRRSNKQKTDQKKNKSGKKYHSSSVISRQSVHTHTHTSTFSFLLLWHSKILNNLIFRGRNHDFYGRHNPYEKRSETKMEYSWQRKLKVLAVGWAKDLSLIGWR